MKKLDDFLGKASKIKGKGYIIYEIWYDDNGVLYVRMFENKINSKKPGTFSKFLVSVSKYMNIRYTNNRIEEFEVYDIEESIFKIVRDNNNGGFLKAVLQHLLPTIN